MRVARPSYASTRATQTAAIRTNHNLYMHTFPRCQQPRAVQQGCAPNLSKHSRITDMVATVAERSRHAGYACTNAAPTAAQQQRSRAARINYASTRASPAVARQPRNRGTRQFQRVLPTGKLFCAYRLRIPKTLNKNRAPFGIYICCAYPCAYPETHLQTL